jgi:basic membrane protein A
MTDARSSTRRYRLPLGVAAALVLAIAAFTGGSSIASPKVSNLCTSPAGVTGPGTGASTIGFIYVGSTTDFGYNEAAHAGAMELGKACPNLKILEADSIPETSAMTTAAEQMIGQGAKIIFSTSYGYKDYAVSLAKAHSNIVVLQQGNFITPPVPPNANTYFGDVYETVYMAGIAAGKATKTNKLGFVAAFPIPQTLLNINAFELGAQSVNPKVKTYTVFTGSWCDPGKQADAASTLLSEGADVLTQHQDCTGTVIKAAEAKGAYSVGYHYDAQSLAPKGWLTGSDWNWAPLYESMVSTILDGKFTGSIFNTNYSLGFSSKTIPSPMVLAPYGPSVSTSTKKLIATTKAKVLSGWSPYTGPIYDQAGKIEVAKGKAATSAQLTSMGYLVKGVIGTLPS